MSATMTEDIEMLKGLALRNPVSLYDVDRTTCVHRQLRLS